MPEALAQWHAGMVACHRAVMQHPQNSPCTGLGLAAAVNSQCIAAAKRLATRFFCGLNENVFILRVPRPWMAWRAFAIL
ncbi:hypothetical protein P3W85_40505 [Cupriavidus basilensis]|uniref:Uncharacterized protein n=1 Tax=Cupriavidus basilensis TaxID=68895 RepID=A0ABT6B2S5_9BURK|nr:hypothetical protein [Cupriavidus basilensis]MDF3839176.1 hypothetical protein [Cupriavidus basilensis]